MSTAAARDATRFVAPAETDESAEICVYGRQFPPQLREVLRARSSLPRQILRVSERLLRDL